VYNKPNSCSATEGLVLGPDHHHHQQQQQQQDEDAGNENSKQNFYGII
jgi:hypothetical protein